MRSVWGQLHTQSLTEHPTVQQEGWVCDLQFIFYSCDWGLLILKFDWVMPGALAWNQTSATGEYDLETEPCLT